MPSAAGWNDFLGTASISVVVGEEIWKTKQRHKREASWGLKDYKGSTVHSLGYWSFHNVVIDLSSGQRPNISVAGEDSIDAVLPNSLGKNDFTTAFGVRFVEFSGGD